MHKIMISLFLVLAAFMMSGCFCSNYVSRIGITEYELIAKSVAIDSVGNIIYRANITKGAKNAHKSQSIGDRYIILNADHDEIINRKFITNRQNGEQYISVGLKDCLLPKDANAAGKAKTWYIYPPVLDKAIEEPYLPIHINGDDLKYYNFTENYWATNIPYNIDGKTELLNLHIYGKETDAPWGLPVRAVLIVPAVVVDTVMLPVYVLSLNNMHW